MSALIKEQIEEAKIGANLLVDIYGSGHGSVFFTDNDHKQYDIGALMKTLLYALTAAEKERDKGKAWIAEAVGVLNNEAKYLRAVIDVVIKNGEGEFEYCIRRKLRLARLESLLAKARGE